MKVHGKFQSFVIFRNFLNPKVENIEDDVGIIPNLSKILWRWFLILLRFEIKNLVNTWDPILSLNPIPFSE